MRLLHFHLFNTFSVSLFSINKTEKKKHCSADNCDTDFSGIQVGHLIEYVTLWIMKHGTYTLACGFFFEKSQARPRSEIRT